MTTFTRFSKSILVAATIAVAIILAGMTGIANAAPAQQGTTANVKIDMCAATAGTGQTWAKMYRVEAPGWFKGPMTYTVPSDVDKQFGLTTTVMGTDTHIVGGGGVETGDYIVVIHNGAQAEWVVPEIVMVGTPGIAHTFTGYCNKIGKNGTGTTTTTSNKTGGAAKANAKKAAPLGTPLCVVTASKPTTTTGTVTIISGGPTWVGKVVFVPSTIKLLTIEAGAKLATKLATDPNAMGVINFIGMPIGTKMKLESGDYQVYRLLTTGAPIYLGYLEAVPNGVFDTVTEMPGVCKEYKLIVGNTPTTGSAENLLAMLFVFFGLTGFGWLNRGKLTAIRLPLARG